MMNGLKNSDLVQSVLRSCQLLQAFRQEGEVLRLRELVTRTSLHKATASRLLRTLEHGGEAPPKDLLHKRSGFGYRRLDETEGPTHHREAV